MAVKAMRGSVLSLVSLIWAAVPALAANPVSVITLPADSSFVNSLPTISGTAQASPDNVAAVDLVIRRVSDNNYWNGAAWQVSQTTVGANIGVPSPSVAWSYAAPALVDGIPYQITSVARDSLSNVETSGPGVSFLFDTTLPSHAVTQPVDLQQLDFFPGISGTASDLTSGISAVQVRISSGPAYDIYWNGASWDVAAVWNNATFSDPGWNYVNVPYGVHLVPGTTYQIETRVIDLAGNQSNSTLSFLFTGAGPGGEPQFSFSGNFASPSGGAVIASQGGWNEVGFALAVDTITIGGPYSFVLFVSTDGPMGEQPNHMGLARYGPSGVMLSSRTLAGDGWGHLAVDVNGYVFVFQGSVFDAQQGIYPNFIEKYDQDLGLLAFRQVEFAVNAMVAKGTNLYALHTGSTIDLVKYDFNLVPVATATYSAFNPGNNMKRGTSLTLMGNGDPVISVADGGDFSVRKLLRYPGDFNGASPLFEADISTLIPHWPGLAYARSSLYMVSDSTDGTNEVYLRKFTTDLQYTGVSSTFPAAASGDDGHPLLVGPDGIFVTAVALQNSGDYMVRKYGDDLTFLASATFNGAANSEDYATSLGAALLSTSTVLVTGISKNASLDYDALTVALPFEAGAPPSGFLFTGTFEGGERIASLNGWHEDGDALLLSTATGSEAVYVLFRSSSGSMPWEEPNDAYIVKYSTDGIVLSSMSVPGQASGAAFARDGFGDIYVDIIDGESVSIAKFNKDLVPQGEVFFSSADVGGITGLAVDGNIFYAATEGGWQDQGAKLIRLDLSLAEQPGRSTYTIGGNWTEFTDVSVSPTGDVFVLASSDAFSGGESHLVRYGPSLGAPDYNSDIAGLLPLPDSLVVTAGGVYVSGMNALRNTALVQRFGFNTAPTGDVNALGGLASIEPVMSAGPDGDIYLAATKAPGDFVAARYSPALVLRSSAVLDFGVGMDSPADIVWANDQQALVTGYASNGANLDAMTILMGLPAAPGSPSLSPIFLGDLDTQAVISGGVGWYDWIHPVVVDTGPANPGIFVLAHSTGVPSTDPPQENYLVKYTTGGVQVASVTLSDWVNGVRPLIADASTLFVAEKDLSGTWIRYYSKSTLQQVGSTVDPMPGAEGDFTGALGRDGVYLYACYHGMAGDMGAKIAKYHVPSGSEVARDTHTVASLRTTCGDLRVDGTGNVYVEVYSSVGTKLLRYDAGNIAAGPAAVVDHTAIMGADAETNMALSGSYVFLASATHHGDLYIRKFSAATLDYTGVSSTLSVTGSDIAALETGTNGDIFVAAATGGGDLWGLRLAAADLSLVSSATHNAGGVDTGFALAVEDGGDAGKIIIAGLTDQGAYYDGVMARLALPASGGPGFPQFAFAGDFLGSNSATIASLNGQNEGGVSVLVDTDTVRGPSVYVIFRSTSNPDPNAMSENPDVAGIVKYDVDGVMLASAALQSNNGTGNAFAMDANGNLYVGEVIGDELSGTKRITKFDPGLRLLFSVERSSWPHQLLVSNGFLYALDGGMVGGSCTVEKLDLGLNPVATIGGPDGFGKAGVFTHNVPGDLFVLVSSNSDAGSPRRLLKFDKDLTTLLGQADVGSLVTRRSEKSAMTYLSGGVYALDTNDVDEIYIRKFNTDLSYSGISSTYTGASHGTIKAGPDGSIYVAATSTGPGGNPDMRVLRYDTSLVLQSTGTYGSAGGYDEWADDLAVLDAASVFVTGGSDVGGQYDVRTARIDSDPVILTGVTRVWTGAGADGLASNPANWAGNVAPSAGDNIEFSTALVKNVTMDLAMDIGSTTVLAPFRSTITVAANFTNLLDFVSDAGPEAVIDFGSAMIRYEGDISVTSITFLMGASTLVFNGDTDQFMSRSGASRRIEAANILVQKPSGTALRMLSDSQIEGDFTIQSGTFAAGSYTHQFYGDIRLSGGYVDVEQSTAEFRGLSPQTVSSTGGTGSAFKVIRVVNPSTMTFAVAPDADIFEARTPGTNIWFHGGNTPDSQHAYRSFIVGSDTGTAQITLHNLGPTAKWYLRVSQYTDVRNVDVRDCDASAGIKINALDSFDRGGNVNWGFSAPAGGFKSLAFANGSEPLWAAHSASNEIRQFAMPASPILDIASADQVRGPLMKPEALAFDTASNLWVAVSTYPEALPSRLVRFASLGGGNVAMSTSALLSSALDSVTAIAFQPDKGDLFAVNQGAVDASKASVVRFTNTTGDYLNPTFSNATVSTFTTGAQLSNVAGVAFDTASNLWVAQRDGRIVRYQNNSGVVQNTNSQMLVSVASPTAIAFNDFGDLYVAEYRFNEGPGSGRLWRHKNFGTAMSPSLDSNAVLVSTGVDLSALAWTSYRNGLWGAEFNLNRLVALPAAPTEAPKTYGGLQGVIAYGGAKTGTYMIALSTDPADVDEGDEATVVTELSSGAFEIGGLLAPNTFYVHAVLDANGNGDVDGFDPVIAYSSAAGLVLSPVFVAADSTTTLSRPIALQDMFLASGTVTNNSAQTGGVIVQAWLGDPATVAPTQFIDQDWLQWNGSTYTISIPTGTGYHLRAFVDANWNGRFDNGEDFGAFGPFSETTPDIEHIIDPVIAPGAAGTVLVAAADRAPPTLPTAIYNVNDSNMLTLALWSEGGNAQINSLRVGLSGDAPSANVRVKLFKESNGTGNLEEGGDWWLDERYFGGGYPPSAELFFATQPITGATIYLHLAVQYWNNDVPAGKQLGLVVEDPADLGLTLGSVDPAAAFPAGSSLSRVVFSLAANPNQGGYMTPTEYAPYNGYDTGLYVQSGQIIRYSANGTWGAQNFGSTTPDGVTGLTAADSPLPGGKLGALIGRVGMGSWQLLGSSGALTAPQSGSLVLAMNATDYWNAFGAVQVDYYVEASTVAKVWVGGFGPNADYFGNWQNGQLPANGDTVRFEGSADCDWNIYGLSVNLLSLTSAYTGTVRLIGPMNYGDYNSLTASSFVYVNGGQFQLTRNTELSIQGGLRVFGGVFSMGDGWNHLRVGNNGVIISSGGIFRSVGTDWVVIEPAGSRKVAFTVSNGTINVNNMGGTQFDESQGVVFNTGAAVTRFDFARFHNYGYNPNPSLVVRRSTPAALTFRNLDFDMNVSTNVDASNTVAGSTIVMDNASGDRMGSFRHNDPNGVISWQPDGGMKFDISGVVFDSGTQSGDLYIVVSTRVRVNVDWDLPMCPPPPGGELTCRTPASVGAYTVSNLAAPNTWYVTAFVDSDFDYKPSSWEARGGVGYNGHYFSSPIHLAGNVGGKDITLMDAGIIRGQLFNNSSQMGPLMAALHLKGTTDTVVARADAAPDGTFQLASRATDYLVVGYVDLNGNRRHDSFEAFGEDYSVSVGPKSMVGGVNISLGGGSVVAGGTATVGSTQTVHGGFIGAGGDSPMLKLTLTASGGPVTFNALRVDYEGGFPQYSGLGLSMWVDQDQNGIIEPWMDHQVAQQWLYGGASSATLSVNPPQTIEDAESRTLYLALNLNGSPVGQAGLAIGASTYFGLSQGSMADQPGMYAIRSASAAVLMSVAADQEFNMGAVSNPTGPGNWGGQYISGTYNGQVITIVATGTWSDNGSSYFGPGGVPGTQYTGTVFPAANRGELIGRIGQDFFFRVGTGTVVTSNRTEPLHLAMNDYPGDYWNNSGQIFVNAQISGSTIAAIQGEIYYPSEGGVTTGLLIVNALHGDPQNGMQIVSTDTIDIAADGQVGVGVTTFTYFLNLDHPCWFGVNAYIQSQPDQHGGTGNSGGGIEVMAGSTATYNIRISLGSGQIAGNLNYGGVLHSGEYIVLAATHAVFGEDMDFAGFASTPMSGAYTMSDLPAPATYYLIAIKDGNYNQEPDGPEPIGVHSSTPGVPSMVLFNSLLKPVFVGVNQTTPGIDITLYDMGGISGNLAMDNSVNPGEKIIIGAGRGVVGSPDYVAENGTEMLAVPNSSFTFHLGLLPPGPVYSLVAFVDRDYDGDLDPGEPFTILSVPGGVPSGGMAWVDLFLGGLRAPSAAADFRGSAPSTTEVRFNWDMVPGATTYQLLTASATPSSLSAGVAASLGEGATEYIDTLTPSTYSLIVGLRAINAVSSGPAVTIAPVASLAATPTTPVVTVFQSSATIAWAGNGNAAGTQYELQRATSATGPFYPLLTLAALSHADMGLAPSTAYHYRVRARNQNGLYSAFSAVESQTTLAPAGMDSIGGRIAYAGAQSGTIRVEASSTLSFTVVAASAALPVSPDQPYFLPLTGGSSYYVRAFVDVNGNGAMGPGENRGLYPSVAAPALIGPIAGPASGKDFAIDADTVAPRMPAGLTTVASFVNGASSIQLFWNAPTASADGSALNDLAGYRVQRTTNAAGGGFINLATATAYGLGGLVEGTQFVDGAPVAGVNNIYRVRAVDYGNNMSVPSPLVSVLPAAGGSVSGWISTFTVSGSTGAFRVRLSTSMDRQAPYLRESTISPFTFTGLLDGVYYLRGFQDLNGDNFQQASVEPSGTHGGVIAPFPLQIMNGNAISSRTVVICERSSLAPNSSYWGRRLEAADCPARDRGQGYYTDLYTLRVGGGGAGTFAVGTRVQLAMNSFDFSPWLMLLGPDGGVAAQNSDANSAFIEYQLTQPGLYVVEPTSFDMGREGWYDLSANVVGGQNGRIAGNLTYTGGQPGSVHLQLFTSPGQLNVWPFFSAVDPSADGPYELNNVPDGTFYLRAFLDVNGNMVRDASEPVGAYGLSLSSPTPILVQGGVASADPADFTLSAPPVGTVSGSLIRAGSKTGTIRVTAIRASDQDRNIVSFATMSSLADGTTAGYTLSFIAPATDYMISAYVDGNGNSYLDGLEASGSSSPISVRANAVTTVNITVRDPGTGTPGSSVIRGTMSYVGASTGSLMIGFGTDREMNYMPYIHVQASTGAFQKSGLQGNTSYYIGAFIDTTGTGEPNYTTPMGMYISSSTMQPIPLFVPVSSTVLIAMSIVDPSNGVITGSVTYQGLGQGVSGDIVVEGYAPNSGYGGDGNWRNQRIARQVGVSSYAFSLGYLAAGNFELRAFVDSNGNSRSDFGEPFFEKRDSMVAVSSGTGRNPATSSGLNLYIFDAGAGGTGGAVGRIGGDVYYTGGQSGPIFVQAFTTSTFLGRPMFETSLGGPGPNYSFELNNVANGTFYLRAYKDSNLNNMFDPAFEASGVLDDESEQLVPVILTNDSPVSMVSVIDMEDVGAAGGPVTTISLDATFQYRGASASTGTLRMALFKRGPTETVPVRMSSWSFTASPVNYIFNNLETGEYFGAAWVDYNDNFFADMNEPAGLLTTWGLPVYGPTSASFELCDRTSLDTTPGVVTGGTLSGSSCRSSERSQPYQKLYTFQGTRGQSVTLGMEAVDFYDTYLVLAGPRGGAVSEADEGAGNGNARIMNFILPENGIYTVAAQAFAGGITGSFNLSFQGSAGSLGRIGGEITYSGSQGGRIFAGLFNQPDYDAAGSNVAGLALQGPGPFLFEGLPTGTTYWMGAFVDVNYNGQPDAGEDGGDYSTSTLVQKSPIYLLSGQDVSGIVLAISTRTTGNETYAGVAGAIDYAGTQQGMLLVEFWADGGFQGKPVAVRSMPVTMPPFYYDLQLPGGLPYFVKAFLDTNANYMPDPSEAKGVYSVSGMGADPVYAPQNGVMDSVNFTLFDPGRNADLASAAGEGTLLSFLPVGVAAGELLPKVTVQVLIGSQGLNPGGRLTLGVPPMWPFPQTFDANMPGYVTAVATNSAAHLSESADLQLSPVLNAPAIELVAGSTPLFAGATVQFTYGPVYVPCGGFGGAMMPGMTGSQGGSDAARFFLGSASDASVMPAPLFSLGAEDLKVTVNPAAPRYAYMRNGYITLTQNTTSAAMVLDSFDQCGNQVTMNTSSAVVVEAKRFDFQNGNWADEPGLTFSPTLFGNYWSSRTVTFAQNASSASFYLHSAVPGDLSIWINTVFGGSAQRSYGGLNVLASNPLSNVTVATAAFIMSQSSRATIYPNGDPSTPGQAFINFTLTNPNLNWEIQISSVPFKDGVSASPIWQTWGWGQPSRGQIAWDGRYSPWIMNGARVPTGLYFVRVEVGGAIRNDTLRVQVRSSQLEGAVLDDGVTPRVPLSGVRVDAFGQFGGGNVQTETNGSFVFGGFAAGVYKMSFFKDGYLEARAQVTLNSTGTVSGVTGAGSNAGFAVSSGTLRVYLRRAPALLIVPASLAAGTTQPFEMWGGLQVQSTDYTRVFMGPLHVAAGTTTIDTGDQWDPATQRFVTKSQIRFDLPSGTYTMRANLPGFDEISTVTVGGLALTQVYVGQGQTVATLPVFTRRSAIYGWVSIPAGVNPYGTWVSVNAVPVSTSAGLSEGFGGTWIDGGAGLTSASYRVEGLRAGSYFLNANASGVASTRTASGLTVLSNTDLPWNLTFDDPRSVVMVATVAVRADTTDFPAFGSGEPSLRVNLNAWSPNSKNYGWANIALATASVNNCGDIGVTSGACTYGVAHIYGLEPGVEYQVFANLEHRGNTDFDWPAPSTATISASAPQKNPEGSLRFDFREPQGRIDGLILLGDRSDFGSVRLYGEVTASVKPERVGERFEDPAVGLPNFSCGGLPGTDVSSMAVAGVCPGGISSATFRVTGINTQTMNIKFLHEATGRTFARSMSVVDGLTTSATVYLTAPTFEIRGAVANQITNTLFNTNLKIFQNSPERVLLDVRSSTVAIPLSLAEPGQASTATIARVIAVRQEFGQFSTAISTNFNPAVDRVAFLTQAGTFTLRNVPAGVYVLRTENLRQCATCAVIVPQLRQTVVVSANVQASTFTLTDGFNVSGSIVLDNNMVDARTFNLQILNSRREVVRSTAVVLGNAGTGTNANSVAYSFNNLPAGEFYTLIAQGVVEVLKYVGQPIKFPNPALSPNGLQSALSGQNVTMKLAGYVTGKLKDGNTGEQITRTNATTLPPNFEIKATANPWIEGGYVVARASVAARPVLADGTFRLGPFFPSVSYDIRLGQDKWDLAYLRQGSQNYAPVTIAGVTLQPGETRDLGAITLNQGQSIIGRVVDAASTTTALGNIKVVGKPSFGTVNLTVETFTDPAGLFRLWVSTFISRQYDVTIAPRGGNKASVGGVEKLYETVSLANVNVSTVAMVVPLRELRASVTGQITTYDGRALSYPFGEQKGYPAAAVFMQKANTVPKRNPLGDLETETGSDGSFEFPGIATGTYVLRAVSLGYQVLKTSVVVNNDYTVKIASRTDLPHNPVLTLLGGAQVQGRITMADGSAPSENEVGGIAAADDNFTEFVIGSVEIDPTARTVSGYTISGFKTNVNYNLVILPKDGSEIVTPPEGQDVSFATDESTTTKTINLTFNRARPDCVSDAKKLGNDQFQIKIVCSQPLRNLVAADSDLELVLAASTANSRGTPFTAPDGSGSLLGSEKRFSANRRQITAIYRIGAGETAYSLRLRGTFATRNQTTGDNFSIDKIFDFLTGLQSVKEEKVTNVQGGSLKLEPTDEDVDLGKDEKFEVTIPPGTFDKCVAGDVGCEQSDDVDDDKRKLNVSLGVRKAETKDQLEAQYRAKKGFAPASLRTLADPKSYPEEVFKAMEAFRVMASTGVNAFSPFYDIFLPLGIRRQLAKDVDVTLSFNPLLLSTATSAQDMNVWYYNPTTGRYEIENRNKRIDTTNNTVTVSVNHFSVFVVLGSTPVFAIPNSFSGGEISAYNFPNPFDCNRKTKLLDNVLFNGGSATFDGTMIHYGLPAGDAAELVIKIYNVAGEVVREMSQGTLDGGGNYYSPWDCKNQSGRTVASGVYIGQVKWGDRSKFFKMAVIKGSGL